MKHRKSGRQFGRVRRQRVALMRSLVESLVLHERIETTEAKAKELKMVMDRIITKAKRVPADAADRKMTIVRKLERDVPRSAITKIMETLLARMDGRTSGYTRVVKLVQRKSDSAKMALIEFVDRDEDAPVVADAASEQDENETQDSKAPDAEVSEASQETNKA